MTRGTLRFRTFRDPAPQPDEELAQFLVQQIRAAIPLKQAGSATVVVRGERVDIMGLKQLQEAGMPSVPNTLALLSRAQFHDRVDVRAVGLIGVYGYRARPEDTAVPTALCFLEWEDGRWWQWRGLIDPRDDALRNDTETICRAVDGIARPRGLGGWWSRGRHIKNRPTLTPLFPTGAGDVVH